MEGGSSHLLGVANKTLADSDDGAEDDDSTELILLEGENIDDGDAGDGIPGGESAAEGASQDPFSKLYEFGTLCDVQSLVPTHNGPALLFVKGIER